MRVAEERAVDPRTKGAWGGFPKDLALGTGLCLAFCLKTPFSPYFPPAPHFLCEPGPEHLCSLLL